MTDRSWKLLVKLLEALGIDVSEIEDIFDFDEICDTMKGRMQEYEELRNALKEEEIHKRTYLKSFLDSKEECERYRKALDEIEKYCIDQNLKYDYTACEILDIIDKAKEGHNE